MCFLFIKQQNSVKPEERIIMINNKLYYGTSETGPMGDSGCVEGNILSSIDKNEIPTENGQSKLRIHRKSLYFRFWEWKNYGSNR